MEAIKTEKRISWIDIAKAIGIFYIVLGHVYEDTTIFRIILYLFHVPLFFILSGFTYHYYKDQKEFILKKLKQLYIPYILVSIISIFIYLILGNYIGENVSLNAGSLIQSLYFMIYANTNYGVMMWNRPLWFIPALLVSLVIINLIEIIKNKPTKIIIVILLTALGMFCGYKQIYLPLQTEGALSMLIWIYIGIYLKPYLVKDTIEFNFKWTAISIVLLVLGLTVGLINGSISVMSDQYGSNPLFYFIAAFSLSLVTIIISKMININKILEYIGRSTLFILLWHKFPILFFQKVIPGFNNILIGDNFILKNIVALIISIIAIASCLLLQFILKYLGNRFRIPLLTYFGNM